MAYYGNISACAKEATIKEIIEWVEEHKETDLNRGFEIIFYEDLIKYLEMKLKAADWE